MLGLGEAGDELMSDGVDDLVSYHGEFVFEAVEATAGKRLLFADGRRMRFCCSAISLSVVSAMSGPFKIRAVFPFFRRVSV